MSNKDTNTHEGFKDSQYQDNPEITNCELCEIEIKPQPYRKCEYCGVIVAAGYGVTHRCPIKELRKKVNDRREWNL